MRTSTFESATGGCARVADPMPSRLAALTRRATAVCACVLVASALASAQGTSAIAGVVRDSSCAVLPGVTVDASSLALIEKVRTVVTDSEGSTRSSICRAACIQ